MTILVDVGINRLPWRGSPAEGLPVGVWQANGTVVGDASGGTQRVRFCFGTEGQPISGMLYNLEQLSCLISEGTERTGFLLFSNMTPGPVGLFDRIWPLLFENMSGLVNTGLRDMQQQLPLFIGARLRDADSPGEVQIGMDNLGVTVSLSASGMGYIWEPRSLLIPGGLRRPADSIFGG